MMRRSFIFVLLLSALLLASCGGSATVGTPSPGGAPSLPAGDVNALIQQAKTLLNQNQPDQAITTLEQALQQGGDSSAEVHFLLGNAYAQKEQLTQAEQHLARAVELKKDDADALSNLGVVYYRQGKLQEAEKSFRSALDLKPNDAEIHYNLGGVLAAENQLDAAVAEFLRAKELNPELAEPYLGLGSVYKQQGKRDEAIAALQEYLKRSQDPTWRSQAEQMLKELQS